MTATVSGTFAAGANPAGLADQQSEVLSIPTNAASLAFLTVGDIGGTGNSIRLQRSMDNGNSWSTVATINTNQNRASQAVTAGDQYRLITVSLAAFTQVRYGLTAES